VLILVRHGESELNARGCIVGRLDPALTELGRRQARAAGRQLGRVGSLLSSPLRRATETAALLGVAPEPLVDERVIELDYGALDGMPIDELSTELWDRWTADASFAPVGGESLRQLSDRIDPLMEELFAEPGEGARSGEHDVVVVSHVSPIKAMVAWALRGDPLLAWRLRLSTGSLTRIAHGPLGPQLIGFNETPALD
jgi:broad specificity phosphatase PhoE